MGICKLSCMPSLGSCTRLVAGKKKKHRAGLIADNGEEKVELKASSMAKDVPLDFSAPSVSHGHGGRGSSENDDVLAGGVKRIRLVITKQQLQQLVSKQISLGQVISESETTSFHSVDLSGNWNWKPRLEPIEEGSDSE